MNRLQVLKNVLRDANRTGKKEALCYPVLHGYEIDYILACIDKVNRQKRIVQAIKNLFKISIGFAGCYILLVATIILWG